MLLFLTSLLIRFIPYFIRYSELYQYRNQNIYRRTLRGLRSQHGANAKWVSKTRGACPLHKFVRFAWRDKLVHLRIMSILVARGRDINYPNHSGETALHLACLEGIEVGIAFMICLIVVLVPVFVPITMLEGVACFTRVMYLYLRVWLDETVLSLRVLSGVGEFPGRERSGPQREKREGRRADTLRHPSGLGPPEA
jgi:hypothetical protein